MKRRRDSKIYFVMIVVNSLKIKISRALFVIFAYIPQRERERENVTMFIVDLLQTSVILYS